MTQTPTSTGALDWLKRRKWLVLIVVWGLTITVLAFIPRSATVREQVGAAAAVPEMNQAMGDLAGLLAEEPHGYGMTPLTRGEDCTISPIRPGEQFYREIVVYTSKDTASKLAERLADKLRKRYRLEGGAGAGGYPSYYGELPGFVQFRLAANPYGVSWRAETGCRPEGDAVGGVTPSFEPPSVAPAILDALSVKSADWHKARADCGDLGGPGGTSTSVLAGGATTAKVKLDAVKPLLPEDAEILLDTAANLSYRDDETTWSIALRDDEATVASTDGCDG